MNRHETITLCDLSTGYMRKHQSRVVAAGITASLYGGELTCMLGVNGAGKSTLLRTLSGFQPPLSGRIRVEGRDLQEYTDKELATVISVVLTERFSLRNMTVEELVGMGRSPYTGFWGTLKSEDRRIVERALSMVGIGELKARMVHTLSDGERQKVMIAKALAQETPVIFLDEPTAFLDYPSKVDVMLLLRRLCREWNKTVFLSTHDLELALQTADRLWLLDKEKGVRIGTPASLAADGSLAQYFVRPGITFDAKEHRFLIEK